MIITFMNLFVLPGDRSEPGPGVQSKLHCASVTVSLSHSDWLDSGWPGASDYHDPDLTLSWPGPGGSAAKEPGPSGRRA